jgi:hypothetical protein
MQALAGVVISEMISSAMDAANKPTHIPGMPGQGPVGKSNFMPQQDPREAIGGFLGHSGLDAASTQPKAGILDLIKQS